MDQGYLQLKTHLLGKPPLAEIDFIADGSSDYSNIGGTAYQGSLGVVHWRSRGKNNQDN